jgi:hypothetical protein
MTLKLLNKDIIPLINNIYLILLAIELQDLGTKLPPLTGNFDGIGFS